MDLRPPHVSARYVRAARLGRYGGDWREGMSSWTTDYPRSDRHFSEAMRRLTRVSTRSVEQPVNLDWGDQYDWPFLYGVEVGHWNLTDDQAKAMREYLLRGGFFMCDDFHGTQEWEVFMASMRRVFPDRPVVDIEDKDAIFHTIYDLDDRYQVPGAQYLRSGQTYEQDGVQGRLARHLRRQGPADGRHLPQLRPRRFLGTRRQSAVPAGVLRARHPHRHQLRRLFHDPLNAGREPRRGISQTCR